MRISESFLESYKKDIIDEFKFALQEMQRHDNANQKLYYFTATYGILQRLINKQFDPNVLFIHNTLNYTYNAINDLTNRIRKGDESVIGSDEKFALLYFKTLENALDELIKAIDINDDISVVLTKFSTLAYITSGNGYYLYIKGMIKL